MDILGGINKTVNFYGAGRDNSINFAAAGENRIYQGDVLSSAYAGMEKAKNILKPAKKNRRGKRLNTLDTEFLPDGAPLEEEETANTNFFTQKNTNPAVKKIKAAADYFFTAVPLANYFYLRKKGIKLHDTVNRLNDIMHSADELINLSVPYGENGSFYNNIAQNLTKAAAEINKANKEF